jgi:hypothetical protein
VPTKQKIVLRTLHQLTISLPILGIFLLTSGHSISYSPSLLNPEDIKGDKNPPKRAAAKAVMTRGAPRTDSRPCLSKEEEKDDSAKEGCDEYP